MVKIGDTKLICNTQKVIIAKAKIVDIDDNYIHIKTYITDSFLNPTILTIPKEKEKEIFFNNINDAMIHMGIFFYKEYGLDGFDTPKVEKIIDQYRVHLDTTIIMDWIQRAKDKYPEKFV